MKALVVPANSSRFLPTATEAARQVEARVELAWDPADPYLYNAAFEPGKIQHDDAYCTSVVDLDQVIQMPTMSYFEDKVLPWLGPSSTVVEIGCGQGEFVEGLRELKIDARGYDPVARKIRSYLSAQYWTPQSGAGDLFVMRCVLPHIAKPWLFLDLLSAENPDALVLVEFQRLEWILEHKVWYQLSHDHVNLFRLRDFESRYDVVEHGTFSAGEWGWVLVRTGASRADRDHPGELVVQLESLLSSRTTTLQASRATPAYLWGAAGKGIVLAHALATHGCEVVAAIDADPRRWGRFMEVSAIPIISPNQAREELPSGARVLVCNPNHLESIRDRGARGDWEVLLPSDL